MRHDELMDLVLQYEELNEKELEIAQAHLQECLECRDMLNRIQSLENEARIPEGHLSTPLAGEDLRQADNSRVQLLKRVTKGQKLKKLNPVIWSSLSLGLAACLVVFLLAPWKGAELCLIQELQLTSPQVHRGTDGTPLQAGDAFVVRFTPAETGWPVVVARKSDGSLKVLHPRQTETRPVTAGQPMVLPPTGAPFTWRLDDLDTTVWVLLSRDESPDPVSLNNDLAGFSTPSQIQSYLSSRFGSAAIGMIQPAQPRF